MHEVLTNIKIILAIFKQLMGYYILFSNIIP